MFTKDPNKQYDYQLTEEGAFQYKNATEYYARVWEDKSGVGQPVIILNEHFNNQGPRLDDDTTARIGESLGRSIGKDDPRQVQVYRQDFHGNLTGYDYVRYESERSRVDDMPHGSERDRGDKILGKEKLVGYHATARPVDGPEREAIESAQGDLRQPWDINRLQVPKGFDIEQLRAEYPQNADHGIGR